MVESQPSKLLVAGSIPVSRSKYFPKALSCRYSRRLRYVSGPALLIERLLDAWCRNSMGAEIGLDGILESLSRCLDADSPRRVVEFQIEAQVQERIHQLAAEANEGTLRAEGHSEYEALVNA